MAVRAARAATSCLGRGAAVPYSAARCTTTRASSECNRTSTAPRAMRVGALGARFSKWLLRALRTSSGHVLGLRQAPRSLLLSPASSPARFFFELRTRRREGSGPSTTRPDCLRGLGRQKLILRARAADEAKDSVSKRFLADAAERRRVLERLSDTKRVRNSGKGSLADVSSRGGVTPERSVLSGPRVGSPATSTPAGAQYDRKAQRAPARQRSRNCYGSRSSRRCSTSDRSRAWNHAWRE